MSQKLTTIDAQLLSKKKFTAKMLTRQWTIHGCQYLRQQELWCCKLYIVFSHFQWSVLTIVLYPAVLQPINQKTEKRIQYRCIFFTLCKVVDSFYIFERQDTNTRWQTFLSQLMVRLRFFFLFMNFQKLKGKKSKNTEKKRQCHVMRHTE